MPGLLTEDMLLHLLWALGALTLTRDKCRLELAQLPMVRVSLGSLSLMLPPGSDDTVLHLQVHQLCAFFQ